MTVAYRVRDAKAFQLPEVRELLRAALATNVLIEDADAAFVELAAGIGREDIGLFITGRDEQLEGMVLAQWSRSAFNPACVVIHFYNSGGGDCRKALIKALGRFADEGGFTRIIGVDANSKPQGFARLFSTLGKPIFSGEMFIFDRGESLL